MTGVIFMLAFLATVALLFFLAYATTRLLPKGNPVRQAMENAATWAKENPRLLEKRLKQTAFSLVVLIFTALTLFYS